MNLFIQQLIQRLDLNFIGYVGYPPDEKIPYPEEFARGYHQCIEDLINEVEKNRLTTTNIFTNDTPET